MGVLRMRQSSAILNTYAADVSGVCSALYELGGMTIMDDASGCNSTYNTHDEPRWYSMPSMIVLAGMVIGALFSALVSLIKYVADPQDVLPTITFWLLGSLSGTTKLTLLQGSPFIIAGTLLIFFLRWKLNLMTLNEDEAISLGVPVKRIRLLVILGATMITASVVSMCGLIGWVGLLIPHISRMLYGNNNKSVIPASIGLGALFMLFIDTLARSVSGTEIPVSILTSIIGAPFFIILLRKTGGIQI